MTWKPGTPPQRSPLPTGAETGPLLSYDDLSALYRGESGSLPRTVAAALRTIAPGEPLTYTGFAARLGNPQAVRAAAEADGTVRIRLSQ